MDLTEVAAALHAQLPELGARMAARIREEIPSYRDEALVPEESLCASCVANADLILRHIRLEGAPDPEAAWNTGRIRAEQGVPLAEALHAYRVGFGFLWSELVAEAHRHPGVTDTQLVAQSADIWELFGRYAEATAAGYRDATAELNLQREAKRSALVEALFTGVIADRTTLWDTARQLGLPEQGPYVVVAALASGPGQEPLPGVESALRRVQVASAWRLLPYQQLGLVALSHREAEDAALRVVAANKARVGVSPRFDSLRDTPQAVRFARLALAGLPSGPGVARFDDHPLTMLVAAAPAEAGRLAQVTLAPVLALPGPDRARLLDTLEQWFATSGSAKEAAQRLFVHPNTVRYRLRRLEELTGRSLADPRTAADFAAALIAVRIAAVGPAETGRPD